MAERPISFADLIHRIVGKPAPAQLQHRPVFGRGAELLPGTQARHGDWWVILHGASASGVLLIHKHRIASSQVEVKIDAPLGAVLSVTLDVMSTQAVGELFETAAEFLKTDAAPAKSAG